jgi:formylglycine-generating enzyme required for sulfatase activity
VKHKLLGILAATVPLFFLAACGEDSKKEDVRITVSGTPASIHIGQSTSFTVTVIGSTNTGFDLAPAAGAGCAITNNTVLCVPTATGLYTLTVTAKADTKKTANATLNVAEEIKVEISQDTATVKTGQPVTFTVTTQNTGFDLSVSPETGAGCVRTDNTVVCTPTAANNYTLTITATVDSTVKTATFTAVDPTPEDLEDMVFVAAGTFTMGCATTGDGVVWTTNECQRDSRRPHEVTLTQDFYMGKYEVTQAQWKEVMGEDNNPSDDKTSDSLPVTNIGYNDVQAFIAKLNEQNSLSGWKWDLPTEAQWEYAARGGNAPKNCAGGCLFSGSSTIGEVAWYGTSSGNSEGKLHPVGRLQPNELGLYDMSGNVSEMIKDFWGTYSTGAQTDPTGADSHPSDWHIQRGGNFNSVDISVTVFIRGGLPITGNESNYFGFRLALIPDSDYIPDAAVTATAEPTFFESASGTVSGVWDSAISGIKSLWNSITK